VAQPTYLAAAAILKHWKIALSYLGYINPSHLKITIPTMAQVHKQVARSSRGSHGYINKRPIGDYFFVRF
jgi:hypothetical protein